MIDKERRKKLALHLRHLSVGQTSNDDFEEAITEEVSNGWLPEQYYRAKEAKTDDPIIIPMLELCWGLYDDTRNHKLAGSDKLSDEALKVIARSILFLHSDQEYEWPYINLNSTLFSLTFEDFILSILTLGQHYRNKKEEQLQSYEEWKKLGDYDVWPFFSKAEYEGQLCKQPFLIGQEKSNAQH
ncbi:hypothetical protein [Adhaeribacter soli]|uniref:Uncharacterized protein n=1 Tax=Adhaeribacter soli TaxID=2607655 RepID=A0A5N1IKF4_9BACT|nr:hypothetical protein [Adhaeribacter soli]KAA9326008.1 hypothetical protein F0P94_16455 [Adhaeribacter soli]